MKIAVEGCAHGELETIYNAIEFIEKNENVKVDLLICCGDFQATRNLDDLRCMAVPSCYQNMCTFYKYYSGEKVAPILTIFIGGNHEASNHLQELSYGGWVAPNIYYLGNAGVINIAGIRIGGISGIFKGHDYERGRFEIVPYDDSTKRSVYHIRNLDVFRLKQLSNKIDIFLSHDWPRGVHKYGDEKQLLKHKPFFKEDIQANKLGSPPCEDLLHHLKPSYWFAAHLHTRFAALVQHDDDDDDDRCTKFLALDKCLPQRRFLQLLEIEHDVSKNIEIEYDLEWLTILQLTNHLLSVKAGKIYMPGKGSPERWNFTPTPEELDSVYQKFGKTLKVPLNFTQTVVPYNPELKQKSRGPRAAQINAQTTNICDHLNIDDPLALLLIYGGKLNLSNGSQNGFSTSYSDVSSSFNDSTLDVPLINVKRCSLSLPTPKSEEIDLSSDLDLLDESFVNSNNKRASPSVKDIDVIIETESKVLTSAKKFKRRNEEIYTSFTEDVY